MRDVSIKGRLVEEWELTKILSVASRVEEVPLEKDLWSLGEEGQSYSRVILVVSDKLLFTPKVLHIPHH